MPEITVAYERKFSDGNYGSEGMALSMTMPGGDTDMAVLAGLLRNIVLGQLAKSAAPQVARAADRELNPPAPRSTPPMSDEAYYDAMEDARSY